MRLPRLHLVIFASYLAVAVYLTWPLLTVFSTRLAGHPFGDAYEYIRHIWWIKHALQTGQPLFFSPTLAYPDGLSAAWLWGNPLQSFPAWLFAFVMPLPAAFNLSLLLTLALNGWAAYFLAFYLTQNRLAAWLGGLIFMAHPALGGQIAAAHTGLLVLWPLPLYAYGLLGLRTEDSGLSYQLPVTSYQPFNLRRFLSHPLSGITHYSLLITLFFVLSLLGNNLLLIYGLLPVTAVFVLGLIVRREWRALRRVMIPVIAGGLIALVFVAPVALEILSTPVRAGDSGEITFSADLLAILSPSFQHPLFGALDYPRRVLAVDPFEKLAYIGIIPGLLVIIAAWRGLRRNLPTGTGYWLLLGIIVWVCSLGPALKVFDAPVRLNIGGYDTFISLPWMAVSNLPGLNISRTPARFNLVLALAIAMLAAYGAAALLRAGRSNNPHPSSLIPRPFLLSTQYSALSTILLALLILYEYPFFWSTSPALPNLPTIPGIVPVPIADLAGRDDVRAVFDLPFAHPLVDKEALFLQTGHQQALIAGHITRQTPVDPAKLSVLQATLDAALLDAAGVDVVILHKNWDDAEGELDAFTRARLGAPFYEDDAYALFEVPDPANAIPAVTPLIAPESLTSSGDFYFHAAASGWYRLDGQLTGDNRAILVAVDDVLANQLTVNGTTALSLPVLVEAAGYHTIMLALDPPCPQIINPVLLCRTVEVDTLSLAQSGIVDTGTVAEFDGGIRLRGSAVMRDGNTLSVWLSWTFETQRAPTDVRFVHVTDAAGHLVGQSDDPIGLQPAWSDTVEISLPSDLPPGEYRVYTGWYAYPDTTPFPVVSSSTESDAGRVLVGTFELAGDG